MLDRIADHPVDRIDELLPWNLGANAASIHGETQVAAIGRNPNDAGGALRIFGGNGAPKVSLDSFAHGGRRQRLRQSGIAGRRGNRRFDGRRRRRVQRGHAGSLPHQELGDGGNVTVALNDGFGVFSAGAAQDGAGEACVQRRTQAGTERVACVGLGLPSAGMGK